MRDILQQLKLVTRQGLVRLAERHPDFRDAIKAEIRRRDEQQAVDDARELACV